MLMAVLLAGCGDAGGPDGRIETVDALLARICQLAAGCPGIASSAEEIQDCPADVRSELSDAQLAALEAFTVLSRAEQDPILECLGTRICGRFGGSVASLSDSDVMEPYEECRASPAVHRAAAARCER
jgi:hypothetical protein